MIVLKGRIIDGNGGSPIEKGYVVVEGEKISLVCREAEYTPPPNAKVIEVENGTIMPGFCDLHVHLALSHDFNLVFTKHPYQAVCTAINDLEKMLDAGFTSMRECGGLSNYLKPSWEAGEIRGPRIFSSAKCVVQTGGHFDFIKQFPIEFTKCGERNFVSTVVDGVTEARRTARFQFREGADFVKLMLTAGTVSQSRKFHIREFSDSEIRAFVEEAENYGTYVAVHAHANGGIKAALRCGVKCIEHGSWLEDEDIDFMVKNDIWHVPTLATGYQFMQNLDKVGPWVREKMQLNFNRRLESAYKSHQAGIKIGLGADFGGDEICPHGYNGLEFKRLVEAAGFTAMEAIVAGTKTGAEFTQNLDRLGTLEQGKLADVVIAQGNPLDDIDLLVGPENIKVVLQGGKIQKSVLE